MRTASLLVFLMFPSVGLCQWRYDNCAPSRHYILSRPDVDRMIRLECEHRRQTFQKFAREAPLESLQFALKSHPEKLVRTIARDEINRRIRLEKTASEKEKSPLPLHKSISK